MLIKKVKEAIRDIPDFPKKGIIFKDITPIFDNPGLTKEIVQELASYIRNNINPDAIACIEARGFLFGFLVAQELHIPFIPIRKKGKLPYETVSYSYELEYGNSEVEMHTDAVKKGQRVLIHDDLLATGGTAAAAAELIRLKDGKIAGFSFLINLDFLNGKDKLIKYSDEIHALINY